MLKKYLPYIALIAAAAFFYYIKSHQRGNTGTTTTNPVHQTGGEEVIDRHASHIFYSKHARCRMNCRHINEEEIHEILETGDINFSKIESDARGKTYPLEGVTREHQHLRVVFAPKDDGLLVVTCIDLDRDWACTCE